jgi:acetyl-CoA carboxylase biotin carboxyl carrier protein
MSAPQEPDGLTDQDVAAILRLVDTLDFAEVTLRSGGITVTVRKDVAEALPPAPAPAPAPAPTPVAPADKNGSAAPAPAAAPTSSSRNRLVAITTPILGTFYSRRGPGAEPFVQVGDIVEEDTVVCIVEVMKMMNSIEAGVRGKIAEILVTEGQLVEAGAEIFRVAAGPAA